MAKLTPMRAIRRKCLECSGESQYEVRKCPIKSAPYMRIDSGIDLKWTFYRPRTQKRRTPYVAME